MGCQIGHMKLLIIVPNVILFILGCAMTAYGGVVIGKIVKEYESIAEMKKAMDAGGALLLIAGIFSVLTSLMGCFGAAADKRKLLIAYNVIVSLVLLFEVGGAIAGFIAKKQLKTEVKKEMYESLNKYGQNNKTTVDNMIDLVQRDLKCCGVESKNDWKNATEWSQNNPTDVPGTCCGFKKDGPKTCPLDDDTKVFETGCYEALKKLLPYLGVAGIVIFCIQLSVLLLSLCLSHIIKEDRMYKF